MKKLFWMITVALLALTACTKYNGGEEPDDGANSAREDGVVDLAKVTGDITLLDGDVVIGTLEGNHQVLIADSATVWLAGVTINNTEGAAIGCLGNATIILEDGTTNTLTTGAKYNAALHAGPDNTTLTIQGNSGKLNASANNLYSAGIGGGYNYYSHKCGNITIEGGIIEASGRTGGAGIGSSKWSCCGTITITGGNVTATGGWGAAGIGGGFFYYYATFEGIIISGGTVTATGGNGAAGIGNGNDDKDAGHNVTITNGITKVIARKGGTEAGDVNAVPIGAGHNSEIGNVVFGGYTVFDGSAWKADPMVSGIYGGLNVDISGDTWTLTPYHGKFTVNDSGKKVIFSPGNLQYKGDEASCKWRFAQHQYDRNTNQSDSQWINHFGWGTWTGGSPDPNKSSVKATDYTWNGADFTKEQELADEQQRGYNWYTLSSDEWQYLFAHHTYGAASVHGVNGVIVLPDGVTSAAGFTSGMNGGWTQVSDGDWEAMEAINALFLPTAGYFDPSTASFVNFQDGDYWTSSAKSTGAYGLHFTGSSLSASHFALNNRPQRKLVRLVRDVE